MSMTNNNAISDCLAIFPLSESRPSGCYDGRVLNEANIAILLSKICDRESFILNYDLTTDNGKFIEFIISGHYFKLTDQAWLNKTTLWVTVNLSNNVLDK